MKVACHSCQANYTIADEKVRGRAYRVRCKRCGATFVVRGTTDATRDEPAPEPQQPAEAAAPDAVWHVLVGGVQRGPLTKEDVDALIENGEATLEHYAWRDGLDGWKPMAEIPEFAGAAPAAPVEAPTPADSAPAARYDAADDEEADAAGGLFAPQTPASDPPAADPFAASPADDPFAAKPGADPFAPQAAADPFAPQAAADPFAPQAATDPFAAAADPFAPAADESDVGLAASTGGRAAGGADLFAAVDTEGGFPSDESAETAEMTMTGARHDTSVLFSLSNLQAIAQATSSEKPAGPQPSFGSGLAALEGLRPVEPSKRDAIDDLINLGGASPFQPTIAAPVLAPTVPQAEGRGLLYALFVVGFMLLAGIIVLVILLLKEREPVARSDADREPSKSAEERSSDAEKQASGTPDDREATGERGGDEAGERDTEEGQTKSGQSEERERSRDRQRDRDREAEQTGQQQRDERQKTPVERDELSELIGKALKEQPPPQREQPRETAAPTPPGRPATPDRTAVSAAMNSVTGAVRACASGQTGTASIRVTFAGGSGRVTTAQVVGPPFQGTPAGSCMARAVRSASVPPFTNPTLTVTYPFVMR